MPIDAPLLLSLTAGIGIACITGVLGCFVVWKRMAYFGDSLAHSALLGVALGMIWGFSIHIGTLLVGVTFAVLLVWLQHKKLLALDTLLGILAHSALAIGMLAVAILGGDPHNEHEGEHAGHGHVPSPELDIHNIMFGDVLTVGMNDLLWIYGGGLVIGVIMWRIWSSLLLATVHEDLARAEGVNTFWVHLIFMLLMTVVVAVSIRIVGILLITSLLIIPAATARQFSRTPEGMAIRSALLGGIAVIIGIYASVIWALPTGPAVIAAATGIFILLFTFATLWQRKAG